MVLGQDCTICGKRFTFMDVLTLLPDRHDECHLRRVAQNKRMEERMKQPCTGSPHGVHYVDNQGLCHGCGILLDRYAWEQYAGQGAAAPGDEEEPCPAKSNDR